MFSISYIIHERCTYLAIIGSDRISSPTPSTSTTKAISYFLTVVDTKSTWRTKSEQHKFMKVTYSIDFKKFIESSYM